MTHEEKAQACDALIEWFHSQDICPQGAIEVMAITICVACISQAPRLEERPDVSDLRKKVDVDSAVGRAKAASRLVLETMIDLLNRGAAAAER